MEKVKLNQIDLDNTCFHFSATSNLESIKNNGLVSDVGVNSNGLEHNPRIYFSKGKDNVVLLADRWFRFELDKIVRQKHKDARRTELIRDGAYANRESLEEASRKFIDKMENSTYFKLDLEEGVDYSMDIEDDIKAHASSAGLDFFYGKNRSADTKVEPWNCQTFDGVTVDPSRMQEVEGLNAWEVIKDFYKKVMDEETIDPKELPFLQFALNYDKKRQQEVNLKK